MRQRAKNAVFTTSPGKMGSPDYLLAEVDAGDTFAHRTPDPDRSLHFKEIRGSVLAGDEPGCPTDRADQPHRLLAHHLAWDGVGHRLRRFLEDLLVAALDRTFAFARRRYRHVDHAPVAVGDVRALQLMLWIM